MPSLNKLTVFGVLLMSSVLLEIGFYSNNSSILVQHKNQAVVNADIMIQSYKGIQEDKINELGEIPETLRSAIQQLLVAMETGDDQAQEEALENLLIEFNVVSEQVSVIHTNTNTVVRTPISVGDGPLDIIYDPVNERIYVTNFLDGTISVIDIVQGIVMTVLNIPGLIVDFIVDFPWSTIRGTMGIADLSILNLDSFN